MNVRQGILLATGEGERIGNPLRSHMAIMLFVKRMCGAEGYRIHNGFVLALRWDSEGNEIVLERFLITAAP